MLVKKIVDKDVCDGLPTLEKMLNKTMNMLYISDCLAIVVTGKTLTLPLVNCLSSSLDWVDYYGLPSGKNS